MAPSRPRLDSLSAVVWESGADPRTFVGLDTIHREDRARVLAACRRIIETCGEERVEYRVTGPGGELRWISNTVRAVCEHGRARGLVGAFVDVTEYREQELLARLHQATFEEALIGLAHTSLEGRFLRVNPRLCDLLGYTAEELTALDFMAISHPDDVAQDTEARQRLVDGLIDRHTREKRYRRKDGTFIWANLTASLHRGVGGEPTYFITIIEDLTERKRAEEEARQAHKMEAIGRLAGGIAHDFNNLLMAIVGYADLVLYQLREDDPLRSDVHEIRAAGNSAALLTRQLLAFSRKQVLQLQILDLNIIVVRMQGLLRRLIGEHINIELGLAEPLDRVNADAGQIEQVILNLSLNARDAMSAGGTLRIQTANIDLDPAHVADHPEATAGRHVMILVSDTGIGMDDLVRARLFEPFYTTKELGTGTGLGLATVYGIVKQSGGSIVVETQPNHGTTFKVFLPWTEQAMQDGGARTDPPRSIGGGETILLVEDQREVREVMHAALTRHGYTVLDAKQGDEALRLVLDYPNEIHLVLTDVVMPAMDGRVMAERLRRLRPGVRVLFASGYTEDAAIHHGVFERGTAFIEKPFTPYTLLRRMRELLDD